MAQIKKTSNSVNTTTTTTTTTGTGWSVCDLTDYSKELAVLHSDMDDITKIKIIQALKNNIYGNIYWQREQPKKIDTTPTVTWNNGTGIDCRKPISIGDCGFIHLADPASEPVYKTTSNF